MEQLNIALEPLRVLLHEVAAFAPRLALAIVILIAGWLAAKVLKLAIVKVLKSVNFNVLTERAGIDDFMKQGGVKADTTGILGALVYWLTILAALIIASNGLGLTHVTELLGRIALFVPRVIVAVLILAFGAYFARFIDTVVSTYGKNVGAADAAILGRVARYAILAFVVLIALDQVDVATDIIRQSFLIVLAGVVLALAIAFGLGSRKRVEEFLEHWPPKETGEDQGRG